MRRWRISTATSSSCRPSLVLSARCTSGSSKAKGSPPTSSRSVWRPVRRGLRTRPRIRPRAGRDHLGAVLASLCAVLRLPVRDGHLRCACPGAWSARGRPGRRGPVPRLPARGWVCVSARRPARRRRRPHVLGGGPGDVRRPGLARRQARGADGVKWVTRERPKTDRIACPWLILRFVDPEAELRGSASVR